MVSPYFQTKVRRHGSARNAYPDLFDDVPRAEVRRAFLSPDGANPCA
ncbi:MAG: hypothetical protein ACRDZ8_15720 [Acidimicrobiales bacterium]